MVNHVLFKESKTARTDRGKESLMSQTAMIIITCEVFSCLPDLLISLLHLFLFLTQKISKYFATPSQNALLKAAFPL